MTQTPQDGGPAFPGERYEKVKKLLGVTVTPDGHESVYGDAIEKVSHPGMALRDWFAGQVLGQSMANLTDEFGDWSYVAVARCAYAQADAMISERNKP